VLFCDMVGFTELANRLDPEVLQSIIRRYEDACAVCITRYDGYVFQRLSALREQLVAQGAQMLASQCSPYYINSAFWPSIDNLERALRFARDESPESKLDKLEALMTTQYKCPLADVRFVASILSIPCDERYGAVHMTPQKYKDETLRALVDLTEAAARTRPSILLFEDAHWADPTTLEVLDLLIDRIRTVPLLVVLTHRPEFASRWAVHGHVTGLNLSKLTRAQSAGQAALQNALEGLTASGLAFRRGTPPDAVHTFKHALVQDAAYDSLLKSPRQQLHGKIARVTRPYKNPAPIHSAISAGFGSPSISIFTS
jgi:predicted ATPase